MKKLTIFAVLAMTAITGCEAGGNGGYPKFGEENYYDCGDSFKRLRVVFKDKENGEMTTVSSTVNLVLNAETETERVYKSKSSYAPYGFAVSSDGKASFIRYAERIPCEKSK